LLLLIIFLLTEVLRNVTIVKEPGSHEATYSIIYRKKWALVVGVNKYKYDFTNLLYAEKDAQDMSVMLTELGFDCVVKLLGSQCNNGKFREEVNTLEVNAQKDDQVVIFIAGHGITQKVNDGEVSYFVPYDGRKDRLQMTTIELTDLPRYVRRIKAKHILFILDCCYSGNAYQNRGRLRGSPPIKLHMQNRAVQAITAGAMVNCFSTNVTQISDFLYQKNKKIDGLFSLLLKCC